MRDLSKAMMCIGLCSLAACGDIGLSAGPAGDANATTTTGTTTGVTTSGTTTSGTTTSGSTTSGTTTSGTTTSGSTTSGSTTSGTTTSSSTCTTATTETYTNFGMGFVSTHCIACHGSGGNSPDMTSLTNIQSSQTAIKQQISSGSMPLGATLSSTDKSNVLAWLSCTPLP